MAAATNFLPITPLEENRVVVGKEWEVRKIFKGASVYGNISKGVGSLSKILAQDLGLVGITFLQIFASSSGTYVPIPLTKNQANRVRSVEILVQLSTSGAEVTDETDLSAQRFLVIARGQQ